MARLHHITKAMLSAAGPAPKIEPGSSWRPSRPGGDDPVPPWFTLTPRAPSADTRVGGGPGLLATLETSGGMTGPGAVDGAIVTLGGAMVSPGAAAPASFESFAHDCTIRLSLAASGLRRGAQALVVFSVATESAQQRATVQSFAGLVPVGEDIVYGDDAISFCVDGGDDGALGLRLVLRLCASEHRPRLGLRGVVGYLL